MVDAPTYDEAAHDKALAQHDRLWGEMAQARRECGADSVEYTEARKTMVAAWDQVKAASRGNARAQWRRLNAGRAAKARDAS